MSWFKEFLKNFGAPEENFSSNFTPRAQKVLALAREESDRLHHNYLGTEHVLLGLMALGQGVAVNVLTGMGLNLENVRTEIEKLTGTGPDKNSGAATPYTPGVKKVLDLARREAKALHHTYIGTKHLLLGLLREGNGLAAIVLRNFNVDLEQARVSIVKELDPNLVSGDEFRKEQFLPGETSNFTPRAQQVMALARKESGRFNHNFLGTEHVLLGLIKLGKGTAMNVFERLGLNLENIREEVEKNIGIGPDKKIAISVPYTPRVMKVLDLARCEAKNLNHPYIGTEHLLLGLLRENEGIAATILKNLGASLERARAEVIKELDTNFVSGNEPKKDQFLPGKVPAKKNIQDWFDTAKELLAKWKLEAGQFTPRAQQTLAVC